MALDIEFLLRKLAQVEQRVDRLASLESPRVGMGAGVYNSANISIPNNTATILTFDSERWDNGNFHSVVSNTGRLTAPVQGTYLITASVDWDIFSGGIRFASLILNGTTVIADDEAGVVADGTSRPRHNLSTVYQLSTGDYVEVRVTQTSGGNLNIIQTGNYTPEFRIHLLP